MVDYVERFERNVLQECPYTMSKDFKRRLFFWGVPLSIRVYADNDIRDYCNLKTVIIRAEREMLRQRGMEEDLEEDPEGENPRVRMGEPIGTPKEDSEEDPEEDPEEDLEEDPDETMDWDVCY